jgi:hypothetical protein
MKRHTALTSTYVNVFDNDGTLTQQSLSKAHREPLRGVARGVLVAIGISLLLVPSAGSSDMTVNKTYIDYKTYALYLLDFNKEQHICLLKLYGKESAWNPLAKNGSHNGIPQGRSEYLARVDGYKQVEWGLSYIHNHRIYQGDTCKAWQHWKDYNWH